MNTPGQAFDFSSIAERFSLEGTFIEARPHGSGHIHDTFLVCTGEQNREIEGGYILQRINHHVFRKPPEVMENIIRVTGHLEKKQLKEGIQGDELARRVLSVVPVMDGGGYYKDGEGNFWRMYRLVTGSTSYDELPSEEHGFRVGFKFGEFLRHLFDLPAPPLHETITGFHNGPKRLEDFRNALNHAQEKNFQDRVKQAGKDIEFLLSQADVFHRVQDMMSSGALPLRVTHNDTKVNNILMDKNTQEALCVIDLDTVMPGTSLYDFGDLARTTLSACPEDERDLSKVAVDMGVFRAIVSGFVEGAGDTLAPLERENLVPGAKFMTLIIGMRFLTDYLQGDTYFKIHRPGHNLDRARRQFKMVASIIEHEKEMEGYLG